MRSVHRGRVVACFGKEWAVEDKSGRLVLAYPSVKCRELPCIGDLIEWESIDSQRGRILAVLPRITCLVRPGRNGKPRAAAANVDQVLIVIAPEPKFDLLLVDQYLVVGESQNIKPLLVVNKVDLLTDEARGCLLQELAPYRSSYPLLTVSAKTGEGIEALRSALKNQTSMFAGQSGVGKSSLLHVLIPNQAVRIGELSAITRRGRHTTTSARLFHLPDGGDLIDTPGVAIFGLAGIDPQQLARGYREFRSFIPQCRFADCQHASDLGCAVRHATETGAISLDRYQRYLKLLAKLPEIS
ncbi:MAG: ribosome small subunit-dependent GTPase A [Methylohalobius sp.]|nr:ribosome small subunit-dependent GTPase A [Methylohalobius sp.]